MARGAKCMKLDVAGGWSGVDRVLVGCWSGVGRVLVGCWSGVGRVLVGLLLRRATPCREAEMRFSSKAGGHAPRTEATDLGVCALAIQEDMESMPSHGLGSVSASESP